MNYRVFAKKKEAFQVESASLFHELKQNPNLAGLQGVQMHNVYDVFHGNKYDMEPPKEKVLDEKVTDEVSDEIDLKGKTLIAYGCLPGQYDQHANSAQQCLMLSNNKQDAVTESGHIVILEGSVTDEGIQAVKKYSINPVGMREKDLAVLGYEEDVEIEPVPVLSGFHDLDEVGLEALCSKQGPAVALVDVQYIQRYFREEEERDLTLTELKVLDTYWSDHCRHTTFETILQNVKIDTGSLQDAIQKAYELYLKLRRDVHDNKKFVTLMDMATIADKYPRKTGKSNDMEISDEINVCSIEVTVDIDGEGRQWLLIFKNEIHNHPTEIEPLGSASTCISGAIRDPLSGRSYVYQATRIIDVGDITKDIKEALPNKLPQSHISKGVAAGHSSYEDQIGPATTYVKEIFNNGYVVKRTEIGAVIGAAPKENVARKKPEIGDIVVLTGGATGRDGVGGTTGSSKEHNDTSLTRCSNEVQKGNAPTEHKLQRLFRNPKVTKLVKKANDFGVGGASVAVGEIADESRIDLDKAPVKYSGLSGTELAISGPQERMAVLIEAGKFGEFKQLAYEESLDSCIVVVVTEERRPVMSSHGEGIVNIPRDFLNTNGVRGLQDVLIRKGLSGTDPFHSRVTFVEEDLKQSNVMFQIGLTEMSDVPIGKSTVLMPLGGKYQLTETEGNVQKLLMFGFINTYSIMTRGHHPELSLYFPYLGVSYSVVKVLVRVTAIDGNYETCHLTNQEYSERLHIDPEGWGKLMQTLLGLIEAEVASETPAIGGKDFMSGTFNDISVPSTSITSVVTTEKIEHITPSGFKEVGHHIYYIKHAPNDDQTPNYEELKVNFAKVRKLIRKGVIYSAATVKFGGLAEALCKMSFGNKIGVEAKISEHIFDLSIGSIAVESSETIYDEVFILLGKTTDVDTICINEECITTDKAIAAWRECYNTTYPVTADQEKGVIGTPEYTANECVHAKKTIDRPEVIIPVLPGQNCEYDTKQQFERAGAEAEIYVFNNLNVESIGRSLKELSEEIASAQILMVVGGFSSGDEPDGGGKSIANVLSNPFVNKAVQTLLANDGLTLGICNGSQAPIKSSLLPHGDITKLSEEPPALFRNNINRHVSHMATTKITSNKSPWLSSFTPGQGHFIAISYGEGKSVASDRVVRQLFENGQIATQYVDLDGNPTTNGTYDINGSSYATEGITSLDGRIFGRMGHNECYEDGLFKNIDGDKYQNIFQSGVNYFRNK